MGHTVVIAGAGAPVGRAVVDALRTAPGVDRLVLVDRPGVDLTGPGRPPSAPPSAPPSSSSRLATVEVGSAPPAVVPPGSPIVAGPCAGADVVVDLGVSAHPDAGDGSPAWGLLGTGVVPDPGHTAALLRAATAAGVTSYVALSTALVYGAWPDNPVPLTEEATLRPAPDLPAAVAAGEVERLVGEWRRAAPDRRAVVLRPALVVDPAQRGWLARSPWSPRRLPALADAAPRQLLALDDLVAAVVLVTGSPGVDGARNVAPEGWLDAEAVQALVGPAPATALPEPVADGLARLADLGPQPATMAHLRAPWVVAADRLRADGWQASSSNEEAFVDADAGGPLAALDAGRRQRLALAAVGGAAVALMAVAALALQRIRAR